MKAQAAVDRARQPVAPRAVDRVLAEDCERRKAGHARQFADRAEVESGQENSGIDRNQDRNRDEEAEQELERRAGIFERLAGNLGVRPEETSHIGGQPETVDTEREHQQHCAPDEQPPIGSALPQESHAAARGDSAHIKAHRPAGIMGGAGPRNVAAAGTDFISCIGCLRAARLFGPLARWRNTGLLRFRCGTAALSTWLTINRRFCDGHHSHD